jgi:KDO2-lipid IV(A) lauroyltransferase
MAFDVHLREVPLPRQGDSASRVRATVAAVTSCLEGWVRATPEQYNWLHRRWKSRPREEVAGAVLPAYVKTRA